MEANVDPDALTVMAMVDAALAAIGDSTFDANLAHAQAGRAASREARARPGRAGPAAVDEPVMQADVQAKLEVAVAVEKAEVEDADLEI